MKLAQLVLGPAGVGKSTYCEALADHCRTVGRPVNVVNLDPAADAFYYDVAEDIRDLISLSDVTEALNLGPNGGLVYCMEYFEANMSDWLDAALAGYGDDDYVLFDCPGQMEVVTQLSVFQNLIEYLQNDGWTVCVAYCLDVTFITDVSKFIGGCLQALIVMMQLVVPHLNILTKMDRCPDKVSLQKRIETLHSCLQDRIQSYLEFDKDQLTQALHKTTGGIFAQLHASVADIVSDFNLVNFIPLDITNNESIQEALLSMDQATGYGEDRDFLPKDFDDL